MPSSIQSIVPDDAVGVVTDVFLSALSGEAEANTGCHLWSELANATPGEGDVAIVLTFDGCEDVLAIVGVSQTSAVVGPLSKIPTIH